MPSPSTIVFNDPLDAELYRMASSPWRQRYQQSLQFNEDQSQFVTELNDPCDVKGIKQSLYYHGDQSLLDTELNDPGVVVGMKYPCVANGIK